MSNRLGYHGAPELLTGADNASSAVSSSDALAKDYAAFIKKTSAGSPAVDVATPVRGGNSAANEKKYPISPGKQVLIGVGIIAAVIGYVALKDTLFGNSRDEAARPAPVITTQPAEQPVEEPEEQPADQPVDQAGAEDDASGDAAGADVVDAAAAGGGEFAQSLESYDEFASLSNTDFPAPIADFAHLCVVTEFMSFYSASGGLGDSGAKGLNCNVTGDSSGAMRVVTFTDAPQAIADSRDGTNMLPEIDLDVESSRGSVLRAVESGEDSVVTEVLPGDEGVAVYMIGTTDTEVIAKALQGIGVAK